MNINNLRYAGDTVLLAESKEQLQSILDQINTAGKEFGMKMNAKKTNVILIGKNQIKPKVNIIIDETPSEHVGKFVYLGQLITDDGKCDAENLRRIKIARGTFWKMKNVLTRGRVDFRTRRRLLKCYVISISLYGTKT